MKIILDNKDLKSLGKQLEEKLESGIDNMLEEDMVYEAIDVSFMKEFGRTIGEALSNSVSEAMMAKLKDPTYIQRIVDKRMYKFIS